MLCVFTPVASENELLGRVGPKYIRRRYVVGVSRSSTTTIPHTIPPTMSKAGSVEVTPAVKGESAVRRASIHPKSLVESPAEGVTTVHDILLYAARKHGDKDAVGWRNIEKIVEEEKDVTKTVGGKQVTEKKTWKYFQLSKYQYWSFNQFKENALETARGLVVLGVEKGKVFNVYAQTS